MVMDFAACDAGPERDGNGFTNVHLVRRAEGLYMKRMALHFSLIIIHYVVSLCVYAYS